MAKKTEEFSSELPMYMVTTDDGVYPTLYKAYIEGDDMFVRMWSAVKNDWVWQRDGWGYYIGVNPRRVVSKEDAEAYIELAKRAKKESGPNGITDEAYLKCKKAYEKEIGRKLPW